ncbi:hypothetical protein EJ02DRAFT_458032 [Clathrospora elynae]|uniref:Uncharacterized protein n=1 Tax=Clathrospora elynae TaxID=706981 RepID=A0A6A5SLU9_9PLEO|nr:hypothetical protein EJ02DRAFT_458032 [Clathrospora elynae]
MYGHGASIHKSIHSLIYKHTHNHYIYHVSYIVNHNCNTSAYSTCTRTSRTARYPRSSLRTLVLDRMQALRREVVLPSTRIAKMGNLLHSTVQYLLQ